MSAQRTSWVFNLILALPVLWQIGAVVSAQERRDYGRSDGRSSGRSGYSERPSPNDALEERQRRFQRSEGALKYLDMNQNGQIEANEVEGSRKFIWDRMAERLSLQPTFPQPVSKLREGLANWYYLRSDQIPPSVPYGGPGGPPGGPPSSSGWRPGGPPPGGSPSFSSSSMSRPSGPIQPSGNTPGVTGFGSTTRSTTSYASSGSMSGMGSSSGSASSTPRPSTSSFGGGSGPSPSSNVDERIRGYAQSLLRQYDTNKNGILERDEWRNMRGDPEMADTNRDGNITLDELAVRLANYSRGSSSGSSTPSSTASSSGSPPSGAPSSGSPSSSSSGSYGSRPTSGSPGSPSSGMAMASSGPTLATPYRSANRFLSPKERLPRGLPDWFTAKDANSDGQVSMAEYSSTWSDATAQEFRSYDLNGDGIVTPAECLKKGNTGR